MTWTRRLTFLSLMLLLCSAASLPAQTSWQAGAAKVIITPEHYMWMSGYGGRDHPAEGKLTELWAKALVLQSASGQRGMIISLDLVGIDRLLALSVREAIAAECGLSAGEVAFCTSHTHTGPVVGKNLGPLHYLTVDPIQRQLIDAYQLTLQKKIVDVARAAIAAIEPCDVSWGSGRATFAVNRRNNREANVPELRTASQLQGPIDHDVPVLAVRNKAQELKAVLFGYACHSTVLSFYQWSGDYPGFAQTEIENSHPGCVAMFFAGCGADQNPLPRRTVELAQHYGRRLATAVDAVLLTTAMTPLDSSLKTTYEEIELPLGKLPSRAEIEKNLASSNKWEVARASMLLAQLDDGRELSQTYPYPVSTWRLGNGLQLVFLGGEVVVDYALRLKSELAGTRTWVAGYANDVMAYIPSRRVLGEGGYEGGGSMVYYGLPTIWAPELENMIVEAVHRQLAK